jgi:pyruvate formate lyase activating enzyme
MQPKNKKPISRRKFVRRCCLGACAVAWSGYSFPDLWGREENSALRIGFPNDGPATLWKWSTEARWYKNKGRLIHCTLCPHECLLAENDRGFCRTRVVKSGKLHTLAYGNPCSIHLDPMEKKPLYHFLPGSSILSIATGGCNLRCLNCQNWEISQSRPEDLKNHDFMPDVLVDRVSRRTIPAIAYTYSEPMIFYEYVYDTAEIAKQHNIKNVLVTAGYINPKPLIKLCTVNDAANVDLKGFSDSFYRKVTGARLAPVLRTLKIMQQEGVWLEVTRLVVPTLSDDLDDMRAMCDWLVENLGPGVPLHISRFHGAYKLKNLPPTPLATVEQFYRIAKEAGLHFVYVGNVPSTNHQDTICPSCNETAIKRKGYIILENRLENGRCPCGEEIPGVWT